MATHLHYSYSSEGENLFNKTRKKIEDTFASLIQLLHERCNGLLAELEAMQKEFEANSDKAKEALDKIEKDNEDMRRLSVSLKLDTARDGLAKMIEELDRKSRDEEMKLNCPDISFVCETNELEWRIAHLGTLSLESIQKSLVKMYKGMKEPLKKFRKQGANEEKLAVNPRGVCIDRANGKIFISEISNSEIEVWNYQGECVSTFGKGELESPWELCLCENMLYVTDIHLDAILRFNVTGFVFEAKTGGKFGSEEGQLASPAGIDIEGGEVFVMECGNKRISVFDPDLQFLRVLGCGLIDKAHALRVKQSTVYLLEDSGVLKMFSGETGDLVRIIRNNLFFSNYMYHFCFDGNGNILTSDRDQNCLFILSSEGNLLHSINTSEWGCESPFGVGVTREGRIVMSFLHGDFGLVIL